MTDSVQVSRLADDRVVVTLAGEIDHCACAAFTDEWLRGCRTDREVLVEMRDLAFLDSAGVSLLMRLRSVAAQGVQLLNPPARTMKTLDIVGVTALFPVG